MVGPLKINFSIEGLTSLKNFKMKRWNEIEMNVLPLPHVDGPFFDAFYHLKCLKCI